jgi:hypothetical protein
MSYQYLLVGCFSIQNLIRITHAVYILKDGFVAKRKKITNKNTILFLMLNYKNPPELKNRIYIYTVNKEKMPPFNE